MKRWLVWAIAVGWLFTGVTGGLALEPSALEQDLYQTGYWLFRCSNINLIHGLNLTRPQIQRLSEMAAVIDALSPTPVKTATESTALTPVADVLRRLANALRQKKTIPPIFRSELLKVREQQANILQNGLRYSRTPPVFSCSRCHWLPGSKKWGYPWINMVASNPGIRKEMQIAHMNAPYGLLAFVALWYHAAEVDQLLTASQKAAMKGFTCCLLPPKDFADPVRIGQAEIGDLELEGLEKIRQQSAWKMPLVRWSVENLLARYLKIKNPGATEADYSAMKKRADTVIDKARSLSDVDFALQKNDLAKELKGGDTRGNIAGETPVDASRRERLSAAFFLLMPGSGEIFRAELREIPATNLQ